MAGGFHGQDAGGYFPCWRWIGWVEEVLGVNSQGETWEELPTNLRVALSEAREMNRQYERRAAGEQFKEVAIQP